MKGNESFNASVVFLLVGIDGEVSVLLTRCDGGDPFVDGSGKKEEPAWKLPGGGSRAEDSDNPVLTAVREVREETGYVLNPEDLKPELRVDWNDPSNGHLRVTFLVLSGLEPSKGGNPTDKRVRDVKLVPIADLPNGRQAWACGLSLIRSHWWRIESVISKKAAFLERQGIKTDELLKGMRSPRSSAAVGR